jgi:hypothetical protein
MDAYPVLTLLNTGCTRLALPRATAKELLKFLWCKRRTVLPVSPSSTLDQLWHWCLLNTDVITEVHHVLGC